MRLFITFILSGVCLYGFAQKKDNRITIGTVDTVYSKILNEKRIVYIHVPDGDKNQHYPVLYILDGETHFQSAVAIVEQISGIVPDMVIVGITNTNRERDLTPTHVNPDRIINAGDAAKSGGGENFMGFIQNELIPYVDAHYPTTTYRVFSGHSLGGLTVVNAFFNHTDLFSAYIAIDPSLWWDGRRWIEREEKRLPQLSFKNKGLFVAIANNLPSDLDTLTVLKDTGINTSFSRSVLTFAQILKDARPAGLRFGSKFYPNEWHGSVELNAEYDALRYLFKFYHFDMNYVRAHPDLNPDSLVSVHFNKVSKQMGYQVLPTEEMINDMAYGYMGMHKMDYAYTLFKRNIENHLESSNAWDSLGDYYVAADDKQKAIEAFSKSLSLHETADTRRKLEELKGKK